MNADSAEKPWPNRRLWMVAAGVFVIQFLLIVWLGEDRPPVARPVRKGPELTLAAAADPEFLRLMDPTHFALPHEEGFAGRAWLAALDPPHVSFQWTEPARLLDLSVDALGTGLGTLSPAKVPESRDIWLVPTPGLSPRMARSSSLLESKSTYRIEAEEPVPSLLTALDLPSWPPRQTTPTDPELLTNSVVQVMLNARGEPVSATLLVRSGSANADEYAISQASRARFAPSAVEQQADSLTPALTDMRWCRLIFQWHTSTGTNAPGAER